VRCVFVRGIFAFGILEDSSGWDGVSEGQLARARTVEQDKMWARAQRPLLY